MPDWARGKLEFLQVVKIFELFSLPLMMRSSRLAAMIPFLNSRNRSVTFITIRIMIMIIIIIIIIIIVIIVIIAS